VSSSRHKLLSLEAGRFFAATAVVFDHYSSLMKNFVGSTPFSGIMRGGYFAVPYFFVLSGFIIYHIHRRDLGRLSQLKSFALKRTIRLLPMFWLISIIMLVGFWVVPSFSGDRNLSLFSLIADFLLLPHGDSVLPISWTLRHEAMFYGLFALAIWVGPRALWLVAIWAIVSLLPIWPRLTVYNLGLVSVVSGALNLGFVFGIAAAAALARQAVVRPWIWIACGSIPLVCLGALEWWVGQTSTAQDQLLGPLGVVGHLMASALLIFGLVRLEEAGWIMPWARIWKVLGGASYLIYLLHQPFASLAMRLVKPLSRLPTDLAYLILVASAVTSAIALHVFVERPLLRWLSRQLMGRPKVSPVSHVEA
jgi:exopolysaccharide production protein ExoZ